MSQISLECDLRFIFSFVSSIYIINQGNFEKKPLQFCQSIFMNKREAWGKDSRKIPTKMQHIRKLDQWLSLGPRLYF